MTRAATPKPCPNDAEARRQVFHQTREVRRHALSMTSKENLIDRLCAVAPEMRERYAQWPKDVLILECLQKGL